MRVLIVLLVTLALAAAKSKSHQRIVGGSITNINQYPEIVALLWSWGTTGHLQDCGGTILTNRAVLTAAHCTINDPAHRWRSRVGSTYSNWGGVVHSTSHIINHPQYNPATYDHDIAIVRTSSNINLNNVARAGNIAGSNYFLGDNQVVWAAGWGTQYSGGQLTDTLRHVQVWTVNQAVCRNRYAELRLTITDNMLCSGWLDVGGRDQCQGDSGGPLYHNRVVVGVTSWGYGCAHPRYPGVNARVTRYTAWIQANA